jgi:hypothetical protein
MLEYEKISSSFKQFYCSRFLMQGAADPDILTNVLVPSHCVALLNLEEKMGKWKNNGRAAACRDQIS